jgi:hypothetical protein
MNTLSSPIQDVSSRPPDYEKENRALVALMSTLADFPNTVFQRLAETILDVTQSHSSGVSLLTRDGKELDVCGNRTVMNSNRTILLLSFGFVFVVNCLTDALPRPRMRFGEIRCVCSRRVCRLGLWFTLRG